MNPVWMITLATSRSTGLLPYAPGIETGIGTVSLVIGLDLLPETQSFRGGEYSASTFSSALKVSASDIGRAAPLAETPRAPEPAFGPPLPELAGFRLRTVFGMR